jgi:murein DD-endopeptidase MepM/ murein hydrolase activator NlpD
MPDRRLSILSLSPISAARRRGPAVAATLLVLAGLTLTSAAALYTSFEAGSPASMDFATRNWNMYPESETAIPALTASSPEDTRIVAEGDTASRPSIYETALQLEAGDTLAGLLIDLGFDRRDVANAMAILTTRANLKRLPAGLDVHLKIRPATDAEPNPTLLALLIRPEARREVTLERGDAGGYRATEKTFRTESRLGRARGTVNGSLIASARAAGVPQKALADMLRAFAWDVDFQHDIKAGDRFDALIEQHWTEDGRKLDLARMLWGELSVGGGRQRYSVYRFAARGRDDFFYTRSGESVVKALLRTPLNLSRVSSQFGMRRHPVLRFTRMHTGIDFAAPTGTPILAAGAGRVVQAGRNGGYGKWVKIRHGNGLATGYAHMSRIAAGIRRSAHVRQGQVIGFVGSTGLTTGPHLHFELHRGSKPINPLSVARTAVRERLTGAELARFKKHVLAIDKALRTALPLR